MDEQLDSNIDISQFDDIRPYTDEECMSIINRLTKDNEIYFRLSKMAFPRITKVSPSWGALLSRWAIVSRLNKVKDIESFQANITVWFFFRMLTKTTDGINHECQDEIDVNQGHLFLSNHRDIAVDPAVVSHSLYRHRLPLPMIGIGDNLLSNPQASDVMKLNRGFIVKRGHTSVKKMLLDMKKLSRFIHYSIGNNNNIWLAQKEGRAKDSHDRTSPAVLKMLRLCQGKHLSWSEVLNPLNIRTVSISYQYDPCAIHKARELAEGKRKKTTGGDATDLSEMVTGVTGYKGKVNVVIGSKNNWENDDSLGNILAKMDHEIIANYKLCNSHFYCLRKLVELGVEQKSVLEEALGTLKPDTTDCPYLAKQLSDKLGKDIYINCLRIYANPILDKLAYKVTH